MKNITLVLLLAFSIPALAAESVKTAGEAEPTAEATLKAIQKHFQQTMPSVKGDAFVEGSMNFNPSSKAYNKLWTDRMRDDFDQPEEYTKAISAGKKLWETPFASRHLFNAFSKVMTLPEAVSTFGYSAAAPLPSCAKQLAKV